MGAVSSDIAATTATDAQPPRFRHEALLFADSKEFLAATVPFVTDAVEAGEPVLVALTHARRALLEGELLQHGVAHVGTSNATATNGKATVRFVAMEEVGRNPARIIPVWRRFVAAHAGSASALRGIGEPSWAARSEDELVECAHHESLLNVAFAEAPSFWLLCPYDVGALDRKTVAAARGAHPHVVEAGLRSRSREYDATSRVASLLLEPLSPAPANRSELAFATSADLGAIRGFAAAHAERAGLDAERRASLIVAVNELATNSLRHGCGPGAIRAWETADALVFEVRDGGRITEPLVGRTDPLPDQASGRGLWLVNQLCDLVQIRALEDGNLIRLHMYRD
jgi:anti-sigma regulatory factor (Ser/Thr protein kinase)